VPSSSSAAGLIKYSFFSNRDDVDGDGPRRVVVSPSPYLRFFRGEDDAGAGDEGGDDEGGSGGGGEDDGIGSGARFICCFFG
jgi:hypothetical protein